MKLEFSAAVMTGPIPDIQAEVRGGRLVLVTRPGIEVDVDDVVAHGGRVKMRPEHGTTEPVRLRVNVSCEADGGIVIVRPNRKLWPRVQRRPRP